MAIELNLGLIGAAFTFSKGLPPNFISILREFKRINHFLSALKENLATILNLFVPNTLSLPPENNKSVL